MLYVYIVSILVLVDAALRLVIVLPSGISTSKFQSLF